MKLVSIIGDSISTFEGYNPNGYEVYYNKEMQMKNDLTSVYDAWWAKVNQALHAYLCVNNAYSGSRVSGIDFPAASSNERITNLKTADYSPDIILIYIGLNDFGNGIQVSPNGVRIFRKKDMLIFEDAYEHMLTSIKEQYPYAKIVCGTLMRTYLRGNEYWTFPEKFAGTKLEDYNDVIRKLAKKNACYLADVSALNIRYETLDGTHPTAKGHLTIANAWIQCLGECNLQ